jgi:hypothetical protein
VHTLQVLQGGDLLRRRETPQSGAADIIGKRVTSWQVWGARAWLELGSAQGVVEPPGAEPRRMTPGPARSEASEGAGRQAVLRLPGVPHCLLRAHVSCHMAPRIIYGEHAHSMMAPHSLDCSRGCAPAVHPC